MIRLVLITYLIFPLALQAQENKKIKKLKPVEFSLFPKDFQVTQKVFEYYYDLGFIKQQIDSLNEPQKALCLHFICDGLIDNSGFYSILLETKGEYNTEYSKALSRIGDTTSKEMFDKISSLYNKYEKWFSKGQSPPVLDDSSKEYDEKLSKQIKELEKNWYANGKVRENLFNDYFKEHKHELVISQ